jgi:hypothetical protein
MSLSSSCNFTGKVPSDIAVTNANLGKSLRVSRADICDLATIANEVVTNSTITNLTVNTITLVDNSYQTAVLAAPFVHPMVPSTATYNPSGNSVNPPNVPNSTKVPLTASLGAGTSLSFSGNDVVVQQAGAYTISYNVIYQTFSGGVPNPNLGAPGPLNNTLPIVNGTVQCFIAVNNNLISSALNAFSSFNAQLLQLPFTAGSVTLVLNAGDIISLYSYAMRNLAGADSNVTIGDANMNVVAST